jgi:hypothetical protein
MAATGHGWALCSALLRARSRTRLAALADGSPLNLEATLHDGTHIWLRVSAHREASDELRDALRALAECALMTPGSLNIEARRTIPGEIDGWEKQPMDGVDTAEWARAYLPSTVDHRAGFVNLVGELAAAQRAQRRSMASTRKWGKWLVFADAATLDEYWVKAATALHAGQLGPAAKAAATGPTHRDFGPLWPSSRARPIIVYVADFTDEADVARVGRALASNLALRTGKIYFKPDAITHAKTNVPFKTTYALDLATGNLEPRPDAIACARTLAEYSAVCCLSPAPRRAAKVRIGRVSAAESAPTTALAASAAACVGAAAAQEDADRCVAESERLALAREVRAELAAAALAMNLAEASMVAAQTQREYCTRADADILAGAMAPQLVRVRGALERAISGVGTPLRERGARRSPLEGYAAPPARRL